MLRALIWKEWRQLALVRWGGIGLGALLPIAFVTGAQLVQRGVLPTGTVAGHAPRDLMFELLPATLALGLWPLIALMSTAQAFAGDRAAGTESFLLERPVPRARVWRVRLLASSGTLIAVIVATAGVAVSAAALTGVPPGIGWSRWSILASIGVGVALLVYLGGLIAASLLSSPLGAVLLGALLGAIPPVLAAQLMYFVNARIGDVFLGMILPIFLPLAYVAGSWLASCRGEPAGRGRNRRSLTVMGATLAGILVLFVVLAPVVVRANAAMGQHEIAPTPSGRAAFVASNPRTGWGGGWIVDVASGAKRVFVPPPTHDLAWSPDGSEVAVLTWSGPLGSARSQKRLEIHATADGRVLRTIAIPDEVTLWSVTWAGGELVAVVSRDSSKQDRIADVEIIDPSTGVFRSTGFHSDAGNPMRLIRATRERRVFVRVMVEEKNADGRDMPRGYRLHPVDTDAAIVGPAIADSSGRALLFAGWAGGLSPSGRFARITEGYGVDAGDVGVLDLGAGANRPAAPISPQASWVEGDRLVWHEDLDRRTRMFVGTPGATPTPVREWRDAQVGIQTSPDGRAIFVSVIPGGREPAVDATDRGPDPSHFEGTVPMGRSPEELVYLPEDGRFMTLGPPFSDRSGDLRYSQWAGPKTLARIAPGVVFFEDLDTPGVRRFVIGGPGDLE